MMMTIDERKMINPCELVCICCRTSHRNLFPAALKNATQSFCACVYGECVHEQVCVEEIR